MGKQPFSRREFLLQSPAVVAAGMTFPANTKKMRDSSPKNQLNGGVWEKPMNQKGKGNRFNLILLNVDTFRADNLTCYGGTDVDCPNLNQFTSDSVIFENAYPEALPTVPIRRNLMTGRRIVPFDYYEQHEPV